MNRLIKYGIFIIAFVYSCSYKPNDKIAKSYFDGLNTSDFKRIESCISDSLLTMESGFVLTKSISDYYTLFQWDSVFSPEYKIIDSKSISKNTLEVMLLKTCNRIKFLHDTATVYKARIDFKNNRIVKIDNFELIVFDTLKWNSRRDTLVSWIKSNYPKLDGFVYDQTLSGARNYLKAINLFKTANKMTSIKDSSNLLIVKEFVSAINSGKIERIIDLMHINYEFIDSQNNKMTGKENNKKAWATYLDWFPDYKIEIENVFESDSVVALFGFAGGTYKIKNQETNNHWRLPAAWIAKVEDQKIKYWQVYSDSKPVFDIIENNK